VDGLVLGALDGAQAPRRGLLPYVLRSFAQRRHDDGTCRQGVQQPLQTRTGRRAGGVWVTTRGVCGKASRRAITAATSRRPSRSACRSNTDPEARPDCRLVDDESWVKGESLVNDVHTAAGSPSGACAVSTVVDSVPSRPRRSARAGAVFPVPRSPVISSGRRVRAGSTTGRSYAATARNSRRGRASPKATGATATSAMSAPPRSSGTSTRSSRIRGRAGRGRRDRTAVRALPSGRLHGHRGHARCPQRGTRRGCRRRGPPSPPIGSRFSPSTPLAA
jgi:hypothetical protein